MLCGLLAAGPLQAGGLTTFEEYAGMDVEQRAEVVTNAMRLIYAHAVRKEDEKQRRCLRTTYTDGPDLDVQIAHAKLTGILQAGMEIHDEESRVEYAIGHHVLKVCPPSGESASH